MHLLTDAVEHGEPSTLIKARAELACSRVGANGAAPPGTEPRAVTSGFRREHPVSLFADRTRQKLILQCALTKRPAVNEEAQ